MTALPLHLTVDRDGLIASLTIAHDLIRTMDPSDISQADQEIVMAANLLQAAIIRRASNSTSAPEFVHSQVQAAQMVAAAKDLSPNTFRANMPWLLLQRKGLGEGVGFETRGPRSRRYTQEAVDYLIAHWDLTRMEMD